MLSKVSSIEKANTYASDKTLLTCIYMRKSTKMYTVEQESGAFSLAANEWADGWTG